MSQRFQPAAAPTRAPGEAALPTRVICSQARARSARVAAGDDVAAIPRGGETGSVKCAAARAKQAGLAAMTMQGR